MVQTECTEFFIEPPPDTQQRRGRGERGIALKKISVMHVIKLGFAPVSFPPG